eukprot:scaffold397036_cov15-Prasinocladus_malaysianus.AAC.1
MLQTSTHSENRFAGVWFTERFPTCEERVRVVTDGVKSQNGESGRSEAGVYSYVHCALSTRTRALVPGERAAKSDYEYCTTSKGLNYSGVESQ